MMCFALVPIAETAPLVVTTYVPSNLIGITVPDVATDIVIVTPELIVTLPVM